jgi:hypothetical protein
MPIAYSLERDEGLPARFETRNRQPQGISARGVSHDVQEASVGLALIVNLRGNFLQSESTFSKTRRA